MILRRARGGTVKRIVISVSTCSKHMSGSHHRVVLPALSGYNSKNPEAAVRSKHSAIVPDVGNFPKVHSEATSNSVWLQQLPENRGFDDQVSRWLTLMEKRFQEM